MNVILIQPKVTDIEGGQQNRISEDEWINSLCKAASKDSPRGNTDEERMCCSIVLSALFA